MEERQDVWIWFAPGDVPPVGLELVAPGRTLAQRLGGDLSAVVIGESADELITAAAGSGVDRIVVADGEAYGVYRTDVYAAALCALVERHRPAVSSFPPTRPGGSWPPLWPAALKVGLAPGRGGHGDHRNGQRPLHQTGAGGKSRWLPRSAVREFPR